VAIYRLPLTHHEHLLRLVFAGLTPSMKNSHNGGATFIHYVFFCAAVYNGRVWKTVDMPNREESNNVLDILAGADGSMWFATGIGLARLHEGRRAPADHRGDRQRPA